MATVLWSAEGGTNGTGITTGNSGGASGDSFESVSLGSGATATYDNTQARGTLAAKLATGGSAADCSLNYATKIGAQTQAWFRAYLYVPSNPGTSHRLIDAWDSGSGQLCFAVYLTTAGKLMSVNTGGSTIQTSTASVPLNAWFRVEVMVIGSATVGQVEIKLFNSPDGGTATETLTSAANQNTRGSMNNYRFGAAGDPLPASRTLWFDNLGISTTGYLGPAGPAAVTLTPATATFSAVAVTPTPQPVALTLTPATGTWSAVATSPVPQPVARTLTPAVATFGAVATSPAPGAVQRTLTPAAASWSAVALSPTPGPTAVTLTPATAAWSATALTVAAQLALTPATAAWAAQPLTPAPGQVTLPLAPATAVWSAAPLGIGGRITYRPNTGTTSRPDSGITARPFTGATARP